MTLFILGEKLLKNPFKVKQDDEFEDDVQYVGELDQNGRACGYGSLKLDTRFETESSRFNFFITGTFCNDRAHGLSKYYITYKGVLIHR